MQLNRIQQIHAIYWKLSSRKKIQEMRTNFSLNLRLQSSEKTLKEKTNKKSRYFAFVLMDQTPHILFHNFIVFQINNREKTFSKNVFKNKRCMNQQNCLQHKWLYEKANTASECRQDLPLKRLQKETYNKTK